MKNFFGSIFLLCLLYFVYFYNENITKFIIQTINKKQITIKDSNEYKNDFDYMFVQNTNDFIINNKEEFYNIFYTVLNNGWDDFTIYCDDDYLECEDDIKKILDDDSILSDINNFIHPYNSFKEVAFMTNGYGKIEIVIDKLYTATEIDLLNKKVDEIYNSLINSNMSTEEKIKIIHDYIINNSEYDKEASDAIRNNKFNTNSPSSKATGALLYNKALCSGYTDALSLFLYKMGIQNIKVPGDRHIWNLIYLNNSWKHLDITWDIATLKGIKQPTYEFFIIDYETLKTKDKTRHSFNTAIYKEAM